MNMPAVQFPKRISFEEFLSTVDEATNAEWVDGEVVWMNPPTREHARISLFLARLFAEYIERKEIGGEVFHAPVEMRLEASARQPDVLFVGEEKLHRFNEGFLDGPGDLAVEVVSPDSRVRDRTEKFREYERAGVREYWLIDPLQRTAEVYRLSAGGTYELAPAGDPPRLRSAVIEGLWVDPEWLWARKTEMSQAYKEWGLV